MLNQLLYLFAGLFLPKARVVTSGMEFESANS